MGEWYSDSTLLFYYFMHAEIFGEKKKKKKSRNFRKFDFKSWMEMDFHDRILIYLY